MNLNLFFITQCHQMTPYTALTNALANYWATFPFSRVILGLRAVCLQFYPQVIFSDWLLLATYYATSHGKEMHIEIIVNQC